MCSQQVTTLIFVASIRLLLRFCSSTDPKQHSNLMDPCFRWTKSNFCMRVMRKQVKIIFWLRICLLLRFCCLIYSDLRDLIRTDLDGQAIHQFVPTLSPGMWKIKFPPVLEHNLNEGDELCVIKIDVEKNPSHIPYSLKDYDFKDIVSTIVWKSHGISEICNGFWNLTLFKFIFNIC